MKLGIYFSAILIFIVVLYENRNIYIRTEEITERKLLFEKGEFNNILIVTMSNPTDFMLQRAVDYQKFKNSLFDVWYILDDTSHFEIPEKYKSYFEKNVYRFNSSDYTTRYPDMKDLFKNCVIRRKIIKGEEYRYFSWFSLVERVNELYQQFELKTKYLWVIEQDSAITGNLTKFMNHFEYYDEDLICRGMYILTKKYTRNYSTPFKLSQCLTNKLKNYLENKTIYFGNIFFSRFSNRYMYYLNEFLKNGFHGDAQMIYPAVAYLNNLSFMSFPHKYLYKSSASYTLYSKGDFNSIKDKEYLMHQIKE